MEKIQEMQQVKSSEKVCINSFNIESCIQTHGVDDARR